MTLRAVSVGTLCGASPGVTGRLPWRYCLSPVRVVRWQFAGMRRPLLKQTVSRKLDTSRVGQSGHVIFASA
jgi:hypothetical protein